MGREGVELCTGLPSDSISSFGSELEAESSVKVSSAE